MLLFISVDAHIIIVTVMFIVIVPGVDGCFRLNLWFSLMFHMFSALVHACMDGQRQIPLNVTLYCMQMV